MILWALYVSRCNLTPWAHARMYLICIHFVIVVVLNISLSEVANEG